MCPGIGPLTRQFPRPGVTLRGDGRREERPPDSQGIAERVAKEVAAPLGKNLLRGVALFSGLASVLRNSAFKSAFDEGHRLHHAGSLVCARDAQFSGAKSFKGQFKVRFHW